MEYRPALPEHNDNVSHDKPVSEFILLLSGCTVFLLITYWILGFCVDMAVDYISPEMEALIFSPVSESDSKLDEAEDQQQALLQRMVDSLRDCVHITYPLTVHLMESDGANAIALPGGRIVVFSGLLHKVKSENGLSFILAHELAHFKNRDHLRGIGRGILLTAVMAFLTGSGSDITKVVAPSVGLSQAQYSQERESKADEQALQTLNCFYGHVGGATEFFEAMKPDEMEGSKVEVIGKYFSSHPEAELRIDNLQQMVKELNLKTDEVRPMPESLLVKGEKNEKDH